MDHQGGHVHEAATVLAVHDAHLEHLDGHRGLAQEVDGVEDLLAGVLADDDQACAGTPRLGPRDRYGVVERGHVPLEGVRAAVVPRRQLAARESASPPRVVERAGQRRAVELGDQLDDDGRAGRVEGQQVRLVGAHALRDGEDLLAEEPVDVRVHDAVRSGPETWLGAARSPPGLHEERPAGVDLEQWHRADFSPVLVHDPVSCAA
ncbi:hypothetical protein GCM10009718_35650 [Isoptericola halotolerans]|uniref:hypothetical protein n=1 Tax=Isoptericola halotolerans TaxID=300560 RepID=UPI0031DB2579